MVNELDNIPKKDVVLRFSNLEVIVLNMTSATIGIDREFLMFAKFRNINRKEIPNTPADNAMTDVRNLFFV